MSYSWANPAMFSKTSYGFTSLLKMSVNVDFVKTEKFQKSLSATIDQCLKFANDVFHRKM